MLAALAKLKPTATHLLHQIAPSVVATLIAAGLISGYNRAFSGHLQQPRMAALHAAAEAASETAAPAATVAEAPAKAAIPAAEYFAKRERAAEPARVPDPLEKGAKVLGAKVFAAKDLDMGSEAGKDQSTMTVATVTPAPQPAPRPVAVTPRAEPRVASAPVIAAPVTAAPVAQPVLPAPVAAAPIVQQPVVQQPIAPAPVAVAPPPVIMAAPQPSVSTAQPMVTVPDRPGTRPVYEAEEVAPPPPTPAPGPLGTIVDTLRPSSLFARAREFGEKIEAAGNDILPNIRQ